MTDRVKQIDQVEYHAGSGVRFDYVHFEGVTRPLLRITYVDKHGREYRVPIPMALLWRVRRVLDEAEQLHAEEQARRTSP